MTPTHAELADEIYREIDKINCFALSPNAEAATKKAITDFLTSQDEARRFRTSPLPGEAGRRLPNLTRQFDLLRKGCKSMGLGGWEDTFNGLQDDAQAGTIKAEDIVEVIDSDYRNNRDGRAALTQFIEALLADALRSPSVNGAGAMREALRKCRERAVIGCDEEILKLIDNAPAEHEPTSGGAGPLSISHGGLVARWSNDAFSRPLAAGQGQELKLVKRPVAFRVPRTVPSLKAAVGLEWTYFTDETQANREAEARGADCQGLYVRDGTPLVADAPAGALRKAMRRLLLSAKLLQQNSEGCATNHYGNDHEIHGLPGWLVDTQKDIDAATAALSEG